MFPDEPTDEEKLEELPEDNEPPFRPATNSQGDPATSVPENRARQADLRDTHPATDTNIQPEELYEEGISGAAEVSAPNASDNVVRYNPPEDEPDRKSK